MKEKISIIINEMISYYEGDLRRINYFLKVFLFVKLIGELESLEDND